MKSFLLGGALVTGLLLLEKMLKKAKRARKATGKQEMGQAWKSEIYM